ncbi:MAG: polysaccharide biosynthesis protein [Lachnospiraceae bacterium]|nr:polysaccharide biosynthesis protein [Lachnospiraceae bacterium]
MKQGNPNSGALLRRGLVLLAVDILSIIAASYLGLLIRHDFAFSTIPVYFLHPAERMLPFTLVLTILVFYKMRLYHSLWAFAGATEMQNLVTGCILSGLINGIGVQFFKMWDPAEPKSYYLLYTFVLIALVFVSRFSYRFLRGMRNRQELRTDATPVMIIGAGDAGNVLVKEIVTSGYATRAIRCIIDDDPGKWGSFIQGIRVIGGRDKIVECADLYGIEEIIIAIPSLAGQALSDLLDVCKETNCRLRVLPGVYQLVNGEVDMSKLREVDVEDLLGRDPVQVDVDSIIGYVSGKTILVTGGGGSIGSELCRQIAGHGPKHLIILDIYENSVYEIQQELEREFPALKLTVLIASVRNEARINEVFQTYKPDIVYHAAAHKHVPLMEESPNEAVKNNVSGTWICAHAAAENNVKKFVLISTDKAVNPTNIMGASKRICEMIVQALNRTNQTEFVAVRFGNVLGSNGSVIPLFKKQIAAGGPVTVTDPEIIRYFMTIPEAVTLVLQAGAYAKGGEIFVLDMGKPVKILELAENLIKLSGYRVGTDIQIVFTGLRPGEKLFEEMLMDEEGLQETANKLIHIGKPIEFDEKTFFGQLDRLRAASEKESPDIRKLVQEIVPTYHPAEDAGD